MATRTILLNMQPETQGQSHQISNITIGPDGKLFVHMGDGFTAATALDLTQYRGKVLRMNLDGSAPSDNPFYDRADGINAKDYVYAYGFRNPFGGAWRARDGSQYEVEPGPSVDRFAQVVGGRNYLWDGTDDSMRNYALYHWYPPVAPVNIAFTQPETFKGAGFPTPKMGHAFVTESGPTYATGPQEYGKRIVEFAPGADDTFAGSTPAPLIEYTGVGKATAVGLAAGPDGLYFTDLYKDVDATSATDRPISIGAATRIVLPTSATSLTLNGPLSGTGTLNVGPSNTTVGMDTTVTLAADNSAFTGGVTLNNGTLVVTNGNALGTGTGPTP